MANIALFIFGVGELKGGGGAERFFADFFDVYGSKSTANNLFYIIDKPSVVNLNKVSKLKTKKNILDFKTYSNRFKHTLEFIQLIRIIIKNKIKLIHIPLYSLSYIPLIKKLNALPAFVRPRIVINIVNCYVPFALKDEKHPAHKGMKATYFPLFKEVTIDGYFCWNQNFVDYISESGVYGEAFPKLFAIRSRFSDTVKFFPEEKENTIVFASRLDSQKHPEWFVEAVSLLQKGSPEKIKSWKFLLCGEGPLKGKLIEEAKLKGIDHLITFVVEGDISRILNHSKAYVSCQDYDNFPSLAMSEAMAAGNAIIARNVGQTDLFVKHMENGLLLSEDSPKGLAEMIGFFISNPALHKKFESNSVMLVKEVHTPENFIKQIDDFWNSILAA